MKTLILSAVILMAGCTNIQPPAPVYPVPTEAQIAWHKMEQYAFVHFGLNTFNDLEWGFGDTPPTTFNPTHLDIQQWIDVIKVAGLKGIIMTAKHHDGFCLWQSKYTEYSLKNSPWKNGQGDMVRELIESCKKNNLKVGLYLSPWDRNHAQYGRQGYVEYFQNQIEELINEYCVDNVELFEYWFDGANGGDGYYGGASERRKIDPKSYYQYEKCIEIIHSKFPNAMIFGSTSPSIRWIGNESGWAGETNWSIWDVKDDDHWQRMPWGNMNADRWLPGEVDVSIRPGWFYHQREDHQLKTLTQLVDIYYQSVGRNANLLLNFPVSLRGTIHPIDSARVIAWWQTIQNELKTNLLKEATVEAGNTRGGEFKVQNVNDNQWDTYWATQDSVLKTDITFTFSQPVEMNRLLLQEYIPLGQRVKSFTVDYLSKGTWQPITTTDSMTTIGYKRIIRFKNITAEKLRIHFLDARGCLTINNIEAFCAPALLVEPVITRNSAGKVVIDGGSTTVNLYYTTDGSNPTATSTPYTGVFELMGKGSIKAVAQDPAAKERFSPVTQKEFDVLTSKFTVNNLPESSKMFDSDPMSYFSFPKGKNEITIDLGQTYTLNGFTYLPHQTRWGSGVISQYQLWANGKCVAEGEFSNIKANPIEQRILFDVPVTTRQVRLVAKKLTEESDKQPTVGEFSIITPL